MTSAQSFVQVTMISHVIQSLTSTHSELVAAAWKLMGVLGEKAVSSNFLPKGIHCMSRVKTNIASNRLCVQKKEQERDQIAQGRYFIGRIASAA